MDDSEYAREMLGNLKPIYRPGLVHIYHALTWGPLIREIVSAATGKDIRDILATEILDPLGFRWTNFGVAPRTIFRWSRPVTPPASRCRRRSRRFFRMAIGGTTAPDHSVHEHPGIPRPPWCRRPAPFDRERAVALRRNPAPRWRTRRRPGHAPGDAARRDATSAGGCGRTSRPGLTPLRWGTGYMLGSKRFGPFGRNAPAAFGHTGLTDIALWADPGAACR